MTIEKDLSSLVDSQVDILIVGDNGVGKSTLLYKYITGLFCEELPSEECVRIKHISHACPSKNVDQNLLNNQSKIENQNLSILDSSLSLSSYLTSHSYLIKNARAFLFGYTIDSMESFKSLEYTIECIKALKAKQNKEFICSIVALKMDLFENQQVPSTEGYALKDRHGALEFHQVSSKMDSYVDHVFDGLAEKIFSDKWNEACDREKARKAEQKKIDDEEAKKEKPKKEKFRTKLKLLLSPKSK